MLQRVFSVLGRWGSAHLAGWLAPIKEEMSKSNLNILFEMYVGRMLAAAIFGLVVCAIALPLVLMMVFRVALIPAILSGVIAGALAFVGMLTAFHSYPFHKIMSKRSSLEANQPFAINHMAAIAASGVPPFVIFKLLASIPEYGEVANESKRILRNVDTFGMDMISAIRNVAERTPSESFKQFLSGMIATIDTGGDLRAYLDNNAKDALFGYRLRREKYLQTLSTYADFYTAILIAAPLFFVSVLSIMSLIGGSVLGLDIPDAMRIGIFVAIPILNTAFVLFIHYTQPSV